MSGHEVEPEHEEHGAHHRAARGDCRYVGHSPSDERRLPRSHRLQTARGSGSFCVVDTRIALDRCHCQYGRMR